MYRFVRRSFQLRNTAVETYGLLWRSHRLLDTTTPWKSFNQFPDLGLLVLDAGLFFKHFGQHSPRFYGPIATSNSRHIELYRLALVTLFRSFSQHFGQQRPRFCGPIATSNSRHIELHRHLVGYFISLMDLLAFQMWSHKDTLSIVLEYHPLSEAASTKVLAIYIIQSNISKKNEKIGIYFVVQMRMWVCS